MSEKKQQGLGTLAVHAGWHHDPVTRSHCVPLYQSAAYVYDSAEQAASLFELDEFGNIYTRLQNPTTDILENRLAALDGGIGALATSSGQQAAVVTLVNIAAGKHIIAAKAMYGGTVTLLTHSMKPLGIETTMVDMTDLDQIKAAIREDTRAIFFETVANPKNDILDYEAIVNIAHEAGVPVICDNTVTTPILFRPFDYGVDINLYSLTKFINGHGNSVGGAIVDSGNFDWSKNPEFWPQFTQPNSAYHGQVFHEKFGNLCFLVAARARWLRDLGGCLSPFNAFMTINGMATLHLRMQRASENAMAIAKYLESHPMISAVNYPGLPSHPHHDLAKRYLKHGFGAMIGFELKGDRDTSRRFIESVQLAAHVTNLGDIRTIVTHPASTTHSQLSSEELVAAGISDTFIRISTGIEDVDDIIADIEQALNCAK